MAKAAAVSSTSGGSTCAAAIIILFCPPLEKNIALKAADGLGGNFSYRVCLIYCHLFHGTNTYTLIYEQIDAVSPDARQDKSLKLQTVHMRLDMR